jgi:hypothetical protein
MNMQENKGHEDYRIKQSGRMLSGTSIAIMRHRDIQHQRERRSSIVFSVWQDHTVILHVSTENYFSFQK